MVKVFFFCVFYQTFVKVFYSFYPVIILKTYMFKSAVLFGTYTLLDKPVHCIH